MWLKPENFEVYPIFFPQFGQNLAPRVSVPQSGQWVISALASIFSPQLGQNFAPMVSVPHLGQVPTLGWIILAPHSGQNFVPAAAIVLQVGHLAVVTSCALLTASDTPFRASPRPNAVANPLMTAPACAPRASAMSPCLGLSSWQKPDCVSKSDRHTTRSQVGHWRK